MDLTIPDTAALRGCPSVTVAMVRRPTLETDMLSRKIAKATLDCLMTIEVGDTQGVQSGTGSMWREVQCGYKHGFRVNHQTQGHKVSFQFGQDNRSEFRCHWSAHINGVGVVGIVRRTRAGLEWIIYHIEHAEATNEAIRNAIDVLFKVKREVHIAAR